MSYKTILVCLPNAEVAAKLMPVACWLADRHDAHLVGLHVEETLAIYRNTGMQLSGEVFALFNERVAVCRDETRAAFERAMQVSGARGELLVSTSATLHAADTVMARGATADLVLVLQESSDDGPQNQGLASRLIAGSGQPVLVVPREGSFEHVGTRVLIAWDGGREAAAAVRGAMSFIERAEDVLIVVGSERGKPATGKDTAGHQLAATLSRHGAKASVEHHPNPSKTIAHTLLDRARGQKADLIVMGAFSHSRVHDIVFGSASRAMLRDADIPVVWGR